MNAAVILTVNKLNGIIFEQQIKVQQKVITDIEEIHIINATDPIVTIFKKDAALQHYLNELLGTTFKRVFRNVTHQLNHLTEKSVNIDGTLLVLKDNGQWLCLCCSEGNIRQL